MANGPYLLLLRARDLRRVLESLDHAPVQEVAIHWSPEEEGGTQWRITSPTGVDLSFALPDPVARWIFESDARGGRRAMRFKAQFLSTITIYRFVQGQDRLYRLEFSPRATAEELRRPRA